MTTAAAPADDYMAGKDAFQNPAMREAVESHYRGEIQLKRSEDWFQGFQDAEDDARWDHVAVENKLRQWADMC